MIRAEFVSADGTREIPMTEATLTKVKSRLGELGFIREADGISAAKSLIYTWVIRL